MNFHEKMLQHLELDERTYHTKAELTERFILKLQQYPPHLNPEKYQQLELARAWLSLEEKQLIDVIHQSEKMIFHCLQNGAFENQTTDVCSPTPINTEKEQALIITEFIRSLLVDANGSCEILPSDLPHES